MSSTRVVRFSYREHEWPEDIEGAEMAEAFLLRTVAEGRWEDLTGEDPLDDLTSLDSLVERWTSVVVGEWEMPGDAVGVPVGKLRALMAGGGWTFESGSFTEFEGNHNDTEITVRLGRV
jgi:hypothetical protein